MNSLILYGLFLININFRYRSLFHILRIFFNDDRRNINIVILNIKYYQYRAKVFTYVSTDYICKCLILVEETYGRTKLENFLENFKYALRNGDTSLGVLDPFTAKELPIKYSQNEPTKIKCVSALFLK